MLRYLLWLNVFATTLTIDVALAGTADTSTPLKVSTSVELGDLTMQMAESIVVDRLYQQAAASLPKVAIIDHSVRDDSDHLDVSFLSAAGIQLSDLTFTRSVDVDGRVIVGGMASVVQDTSLAKKQLELYYNSDAAKREVARLARELDEKQRQIDALRSNHSSANSPLDQQARLIADIQEIRKRQVVGAITTTTGTIGEALDVERERNEADLIVDAETTAQAINQAIYKLTVAYLDSCLGPNPETIAGNVIREKPLSCNHELLKNGKSAIFDQLYGDEWHNHHFTEKNMIAGSEYPGARVSARTKLLQPEIAAQNKPKRYEIMSPTDVFAYRDPACESKVGCEPLYPLAARLLLTRQVQDLVVGRKLNRENCPIIAGIRTKDVSNTAGLRGKQDYCAKAMTHAFGGFVIKMDGQGHSRSLFYPLASVSVWNPEHIADWYGTKGNRPAMASGSFGLREMHTLDIPSWVLNHAESVKVVVIYPEFKW